MFPAADVGIVVILQFHISRKWCDQESSFHIYCIDVIFTYEGFEYIAIKKEIKGAFWVAEKPSAFLSKGLKGF